MKTTKSNESAEKKPLLVKRSSAERGTTELGWLHSRHSFSFGNYFDPDHMGLAIENASALEFESRNGSQFLLFDLN